MNFLRIEHTYGQIGIDAYNSELQIQSKLSKLNLQHSDAKIQIEKESPKVVIDQHECFATAGLKNVFELTDEAAQLGMQQSMEYAAKKAAEGDALANIKSKSNTIAEIARQNTVDQHEFNIDLIPKARPKIEIEGYIKFSLEKGQVVGNIEDGYIDINFSNPRLDMYLKVKPSLSIEYIGNNFDAYA